MRTTPLNTETAPASGRSTRSCIAATSSGASVMRKYASEPSSRPAAPPLTGGISATSSPARIGKSAETYSAFTATITESRIDASAG